MATYRIDNLDVKVRVVLNMLKERDHVVEIEETTFIETDDSVAMGILEIAGFVSEDQRKEGLRNSNGQVEAKVRKYGPRKGTKYKKRQQTEKVAGEDDEAREVV